MIVYELTHFFNRENGNLTFEPLMLGLYTSLDIVHQAVRYYISKPGFCDNQEAFSVRQREVKGMVEASTVYEAMVYFHTDDYEYEYCVELGLFSDELAAQEVLSTYIHENHHLFSIQKLVAEKIVNRCILNKREWDEGFFVS